MTEKAGLEADELAIERDIVNAFSFALIEFEDALFHKFLRTAGYRSLMTQGMFRKHLSRMHAKGYIAPLEFQGRRAWKKLLIVHDAEKRFIKQREVEDIKPPVVSREKLVTQSRIIAKDILETMEKSVKQGTSDEEVVQEQIAQHVCAMRKALAESPGMFLEYIDDKLPGLRGSMETILKSRGEEFLLLSFRHIELS
jgi:hypothetical protein